TRSERSKLCAPAVREASPRSSTELTSTATSTTTRATTAISTRATTETAVSTARVPRKSRSRAAVLLYLLLVAWTTFAFAGVYACPLSLPAAICLCLALAGRPGPAPDERSLPLDCSLELVAGALIVQLLPLPAVAVDAISPAVRPTRERVFFQLPALL